MVAFGQRITPGSCWSCRKRRLKCDLQRPICSKCISGSLECSYSAKRDLQWVGGAATRGKLKSMKTTSTSNTVVKSNSSPRLSISPLASSPFVPECLVQYFANVVLPRLQLSESLISVDGCDLTTEPALHEAVLALSQAHHHSLLSWEDTPSPGNLSREQARQLALHRFRTRISLGISSANEAQELFQIVVLFCILDGVLSPDVEACASEQHLRGGFTILSGWSSVQTKMLMSGGLQGHLLSVFATMDLFRSLLVGDAPFLDPTVWPMFAHTQTWWGKLPYGDRFLDLLKIFSEISAAGNRLRSSSNDFAHEIAEKSAQAAFVGLNSNSEPPQGPDSTRIHEWADFCMLYEATARVYIYRVLEHREIDDIRVQDVVRRAISALVDRPPTGMLAHCLIFPLLILGSHCIHSQDRKAILHTLSPSVSYLAFGNLVLMLDFLRRLWSSPTNANICWWEMFRPLHGVFLF